MSRMRFSDKRKNSMWRNTEVRRGAITTRHVNYLVRELRRDPTLYLDEMRDLVRERFGARYHLSTICRTLMRNKFSRKILSVISSRRNEFDRATFKLTMSHFEAHMLVFLDETRKAARSLERVYGRGPRGQRVICRRYFTRNLSGHSALGVFTLDGMIDCGITNAKGVDTAIFMKMIYEHVIKHLNRFPRKNSVVIADNAAVHQFPGFRQLIESTGAVLVMMSAYSYDLNPIEHAFSKVKSHIMRHREFAREMPRAALYSAMMSVGPDAAAGYFRHCGYPVDEPLPGVYF